MIIVLVGAPGAGKGTHAKLVAKKLGLPHVSSGDALREAAERGTPLGIEAGPHMKAGALVPDEILLAWADELLAKPEYASGVILDGFPRTLPQAEGLAKLLRKRGLRIDCVMLLDIDEDDAVARLSARVSCPTCGAVYNMISKPPTREGTCDACAASLEMRSDDNEATIRARFREYHRLTEPMIEYYRSRGMLSSVPTAGPIADVERALEASLDEHLRRNTRGTAAG
jgi:adenylate kinase